MRGKLAVAVLCLGSAPQVTAQSTADDVVRTFFQAEREGRWLDAARMLELRRFESMRQATVAGLRKRPPMHHVTAQEIMRMQPDMPRVAAEYQARQMEESMQKYNPLEDQFARVSSVDSLAALSTDEAAARWLEAMGPKWREALASKRMEYDPPIDCPHLPDSLMKSMVARGVEQNPVSTRILGSAAPTDSTRYVVVAEEFASQPLSARTGADADTPNSPRVLTLRRIGGEWKIVPRYDMPQASGTYGGTFLSVRCLPDSVSKGRARK
ncbi:MAG TPA: hypothetical protein VE110_11110 [Gemmatimonadaceae bacterium]|nr:hypothetical protein [Gemmatimonadaceae bacterium]